MLMVRGTRIAFGRLIHSMCDRPDPAIRLTIFGQMVPTARMVAMLLKQCAAIDEIRLYGQDEHVCHTAIDLAQLDTNTLIRAYKGDARLLKESITGASIILVCGGLPITAAEETDADTLLFERNVTAVRNITLHAIEHAPQALLLLATPPINALVPLVSEEYKKEAVYDPRRIIGVSTLNTVRANAIIGKYLAYNPIHVHCPVIGGDSVHTRIPILSQCTPALDGVAEDDRIALYDTIVRAGKTCLEEKARERLGPAYLSQAFAITRFVTNLVHAMRGADGIYECAYVRQTGHINAFLPYMQSIVKLGAHGIAGSYMPKCTQWECDRLLRAYPYLKEDIFRGASFVTGELVRSKRQQTVPACDVHPMTQMLRSEHVGDVMIDFGSKYRNFEVYQ